jgi:glutamate--cysteine ligase
MKSYLEMRGADGGRWDRICALPALWVGLLYTPDALDAAWDLVKHWTPQDHARLRAEVPGLALAATSPNGGTLQSLARQLLAIADRGLAARARLNRAGDSEQGFLGPLHDIAETGLTNADRLLARFAETGSTDFTYESESF